LPESKHHSFATYLLVKTANQITIAILCRGSLATQWPGSEKMARPSGFRHLFRDRIVSGHGRRTGNGGPCSLASAGDASALAPSPVIAREVALASAGSGPAWFSGGAIVLVCVFSIRRVGSDGAAIGDCNLDKASF
jgi:hypothetical protein